MCGEKEKKRKQINVGSRFVLRTKFMQKILLEQPTITQTHTPIFIKTINVSHTLARVAHTYIYILYAYITLKSVENTSLKR